MADFFQGEERVSLFFFLLLLSFFSFKNFPFKSRFRRRPSCSRSSRPEGEAAAAASAEKKRSCRRCCFWGGDLPPEPLSSFPLLTFFRK